MAIILQLPLCLYELQGSVVCVDDHFLPHNVILPLSLGFHDGIHLFVIGGYFWTIGKCLNVICHWMPLPSKNCTNNIVGGVYLNFKWLLQVW